MSTGGACSWTSKSSRAPRSRWFAATALALNLAPSCLSFDRSSDADSRSSSTRWAVVAPKSRCVRDWALRLVRRGHDVLLVSLLPFEDFEDELRSKGIVTASLNMKKGSGSVVALARLARLVRAFRPDVVHAHMFAAIIASRAARALLSPSARIGTKLPVVVGTAHTPFEVNTRRYLVYRLTERFSDLWTCVCQEGVDTHERKHAVRRGTGVLTINGIDTIAFMPNEALRRKKRAELGVADETFLWFTAGSFRDEQKDYGNLLQAFAQIVDVHRNARLFVAGAGQLLDEKRRIAEGLGLRDRVRFLGLRSDIRELLNAADAFVLASAWEAMPIVLLEAAASALPMVCTRVGQNADLVVDGTGFLVPLKDPVALAAAMGRISSAPVEERRRMGASARRHVSSAYDLDVVVEGWERRYRAMLEQRGVHLPTRRGDLPADS